MRSDFLCPAPPWAPRLAWHPGDLRGGLASATLTLVSTVSYAAVAAAPLGASSAAGAVISGIIGASVGAAVVSLFGPVPTQISSLRASVAVVIAAAITSISQHTAPGPGATTQVLAWLTACLLLSALLQWLFGALRLGALIRLVPHAVTAGFTIGIAIEMVASQWSHLFGARAAGGTEPSLPPLLAAMVVATICWANRRGWRGWAMPAGLLAGVAAHQLLGMAFDAPALPSLHAIDLSVAPLLSLPGLVGVLNAGNGLALGGNLFAFALVIALVNSIETLTSAVALEDLTQQRFDANRALRVGALGSLAAVCAGGLPVGGGAATSVANLRAGARTRVSGLVAVVALLALAWLCRPWVGLVPMAVVAGLMITVAGALARAPLTDMLAPWREPSQRTARHVGDLAVAALVCALLLSTGMLTAMLVGIVAATGLIVAQMRRTLVRRSYDATEPGLAPWAGVWIEPRSARQIRIFEVTQPLFFATTETLVAQVESMDPSARVAIMDLTHGRAVDATALRMLARCCTTLRSRGQRAVMVVGPHLAAADRAAMPCPAFVDLASALGFAAGHFHRAEPVAQPAAQACSRRQAQATAQASPQFVIEPDPSDRRNTTMVEPIRAKLSVVGTQAEPAPAAVTIDPAIVEKAARDLTVFVGPVAKVLAQRAAARCTSVGDFYRSLALELNSADERAAFLRDRPASVTDTEQETLPLRTNVLALIAGQQATLSSGLALTPEVLEQATRELSVYLGPLSKLLVARAHAKAVDREHLYRLLARQIGNAVQREAFLLAAGVQMRPFDPLQR